MGMTGKMFQADETVYMKSGSEQKHGEWEELKYN